MGIRVSMSQNKYGRHCNPGKQDHRKSGVLNQLLKCSRQYQYAGPEALGNDRNCRSPVSRMNPRHCRKELSILSHSIVNARTRQDHSTHTRRDHSRRSYRQRRGDDWPKQLAGHRINHTCFNGRQRRYRKGLEVQKVQEKIDRHNKCCTNSHCQGYIPTRILNFLSDIRCGIPSGIAKHDWN